MDTLAPRCRHIITGQFYVICYSSGDGHVSDVRHYSLTEIQSDLLQFAAQYLSLHGRLVYWLPVHRQQSVMCILSQFITANAVVTCEKMITQRPSVVSWMFSAVSVCLLLCQHIQNE